MRLSNLRKITTEIPFKSTEKISTGIFPRIGACRLVLQNLADDGRFIAPQQHVPYRNNDDSHYLFS